MSRSLFVFTLIATPLLAVMVIPAVAAPPDATPNGTAPNATVTAPGTGVVHETVNQTANESGEIAAESNVLEDVDGNVELVGWQYEAHGEFVLEFRAERHATVTVAEAVQFSEGTGQGSLVQQRLMGGETTTVVVPVDPPGEHAAVTITTDRSIKQERFTYVSTGQAETTNPPVEWGTVQLLLLAVGVGTSYVTHRTTRRKMDDETEEVERIL